MCFICVCLCVSLSVCETHTHKDMCGVCTGVYAHASEPVYAHLEAGIFYCSTLFIS